MESIPFVQLEKKMRILVALNLSVSFPMYACTLVISRLQSPLNLINFALSVTPVERVYYI